VEFSKASHLPAGPLQMPQTFVGETCSIGIGLTDARSYGGSLPDRTVTKPSKEFAHQINVVFESCVNRNGVGGIAHWSGFEILIVDPRASLISGTILVWIPPLSYLRAGFLSSVRVNEFNRMLGHVQGRVAFRQLRNILLLGYERNVPGLIRRKVGRVARNSRGGWRTRCHPSRLPIFTLPSDVVVLGSSDPAIISKYCTVLVVPALLDRYSRQVRRPYVGRDQIPPAVVFHWHRIHTALHSEKASGM